MHWNVWDYTDQPFQLMGQICLPFTIIFSGLCAVGILLSGYLLHFSLRRGRSRNFMYYDVLFFRQLKSIIKNAIIHPQKICPFTCVESRIQI